MLRPCDIDALPPLRLRDGGSRNESGKLCRLQHWCADVTDMTGDVPQSWRHGPTSRAHHHDWFALFHRNHANWLNQVGVVRDHYRVVEQSLPGVVQQMYRQVHVRALFFHRMDFGDHCIVKRRRGPTFLLSRTRLRIALHRQRLWTRSTYDSVVPGGQGSNRRCVDCSAGHRQVSERTPDRFGQKATHVYLYLWQRLECAQESLLTGRRSVVRYPRDARGEVLQLVHDITAGNNWRANSTRSSHLYGVRLTAP